MTPEQYCQTRAAPSGSALYSALLFEDQAMRNALLGLYALAQEISKIPLNCHEPEVALKTLDWWRDEIAAAYQEQATHPATILLQQTLKSHPLAQEYFEEQLDACRQLVINRHLTEKQDLALYYHRSGGVLWLMAAELCGYQERSSHRIAIRLGSAMEQLKLIARLREYIDRDFLLLPEDLIKQHAVSRSDLHQVATTKPVQAMLGDLCLQLQENIQKDLDLLPATDRWSLRHLIIQAELGLALLAAMKDIDYMLLEQAVHLPPLRSVWIAWRINRREKKTMNRSLL